MPEHYFSLLAQWSTDNLGTLIFYLTAIVAIPLAYGVLFDAKIIRCGFLLIGVFGAISLLFMLLQAQFLALAQLMIYAVGISLVVVIALMLTNPRMESESSTSIPTHKWPSIVVSILVFLTIYMGLRSEVWTPHAPTNAMWNPGDNVLKIGLHLVTYYSLPFEFASVLLLIALVGAIMLARAEETAQKETWLIPDAEEQFEGSHADVAKV